MEILKVGIRIVEVTQQSVEAVTGASGFVDTSSPLRFDVKQ
jgi:hypothetical protein